MNGHKKIKNLLKVQRYCKKCRERKRRGRKGVSERDGGREGEREGERGRERGWRNHIFSPNSFGRRE
jgi:hypothetical protein